MTTTFGGLPCLDPSAEYEAASLLGQPTAPWWGSANHFACPLGPGPGRGAVLMIWDDLARLDREASHDLVIAGAGMSVTLRNLVVGNAQAAVCGARGDGRASFWVEVMDRRALAMAGPPLNASYNVLDATGAAYLSASKNGGSAWTWATMLAAIWAANGLMGTYPGLPFTPEGIPEGFTFWGVPSFDAINQVLDRVGCALKLDPVADTFSIVRIAADDDDAAAALERADPVRIWDAYPIEPARPRVPEKVRVFFPVVRAAGDTTGASPYYTLDRTDASPDAGVEAGTVAAVHDDLSAVYNATATLTNAAALGTRADERASDYYRRIKEERLSRRYSGVMSGLRPGSKLKGVVWADRGGGVVTDVYRVPGYGPPDAALAGAAGAAEDSPFPEPGAAGAPGRPGGVGGAGPGGAAGGRGASGGRGAPGAAGASGGWGLLSSTLWMLLRPLVMAQTTLSLVTSAFTLAANTTWTLATGVTWSVTGGTFNLCSRWTRCRTGITMSNGANTLALSGVVTPVIRLTGPAAAFTITAITGAVDGDSLTILNASTGELTLPAASPFSLSVPVTVPAGETFGITYDGTSSLWRLTSAPPQAAGAQVGYSGTLAAAGSTQGDAAAVTAGATYVTGADGTKGVILPDVSGARLEILNSSAGNLNVYPPTGGSINGAGTDNAITLSASRHGVYFRVSSTQWYQAVGGVISP